MLIENSDECKEKALEIRENLVKVALDWETLVGVAPQITSSISELDAMLIVDCCLTDVFEKGKIRTAVTKGNDFINKNVRYQVKANRPSGKKGSKVTLVGKARNYEWNKLIWILYNKYYFIEEAWELDVDAYRDNYANINRISPAHMRGGKNLLDDLPECFPRQILAQQST